MKTNKRDIERTLKHMCTYFTRNLDPNNQSIISNQMKNEVSYTFGVPLKKLEDVSNLGELIEMTYKNRNNKSDHKEDLNLEIEEMFSLSKIYLIQNQKINSNSYFIRRYFSGMFCF